ncbi:MAG: hypothetical protein RBR26_06780 [Methanosarcina mazei]|nr:hypothetical protein [Methanosarcina mazei]
MKKAVAVVAVIAVLVGGMLVLIAGVSDSEASPVRAIRIAQSGNAAELTVDLNPGDTVIWDLGDGRIIKGPSVETTYHSGFYFIQAIIISSTGATEHLQRWIGVYDSTPPTTVARNAEYRYCVYTGTEPPSLTVKDSSGRTASWLTYDQAHRVVTGVPRETGTYHVWLNNAYWSIYVTEAPLSAPWVRFDASVEGSHVSASPTGSASDSVARYSWSLTALDGKLVSAYEGRTLSMAADPGIYILKLQQVGPSGSASYSQIVNVHSEPAPEPAEEGPLPVWAMALGAVAVILLAVAVISGSPLSAGAALLCAIAAVVTVII